jgi:hypothetical protein
MIDIGAGGPASDADVEETGGSIPMGGSGGGSLTLPTDRGALIMMRVEKTKTAHEARSPTPDEREGVREGVVHEDASGFARVSE